MSYDYRPEVLIERIRRQGLFYVVLDFDADAIEPLEELVIKALTAMMDEDRKT